LLPCTCSATALSAAGRLVSFCWARWVQEKRAFVFPILNRWVNIVVAIVTIAYIWGGMASYPHYLFIATVETLCLLLIIGFAWAWRNVEA